MTATTVTTMSTTDKIATVNAIIRAQRGKFFTVCFTSKIDGTERKINGRTGVVKYLKGGGVHVSKPNRALIKAFNVKKMGYRTINVMGVTKIVADGAVYEFEWGYDNVQ